jgi:hypothetical protein
MRADIGRLWVSEWPKVMARRTVSDMWDSVGRWWLSSSATWTEVEALGRGREGRCGAVGKVVAFVSCLLMHVKLGT